jgi:hypothetical protein
MRFARRLADESAEKLDIRRNISILDLPEAGRKAEDSTGAEATAESEGESDESWSMKIRTTETVGGVTPAHAVRIYDDDGKDITTGLGAARIEILIDPADVVRAKVTCYLSEMDVNTHVERIVICPMCRERQNEAKKTGHIETADATTVGSDWRNKIA